MQDLEKCINEAAFSNHNAEDYINIDNDEHTETDTMDIDGCISSDFIESQKGNEEEEENDEEEKIYIVIERNKDTVNV
jgi:hypothetical protein